MTEQWQKRDHFLIRKLVELGTLKHSIEYQRYAMRFPSEKRNIILIFTKKSYDDFTFRLYIRKRQNVLKPKHFE